LEAATGAAGGAEGGAADPPADAADGAGAAAALRDTGSGDDDAAADPTARIVAAYGQRDFDGVRRLAEAAAAAGTLGPDGWLPWLRALANQGCLEEAAAVAERAIAACGPTAELLYLQAVLQLQAGHAAAAAALVRRALYLNRDLVVAHMTLAEAQRRLGRLDNARRSLRSAATLLQSLPDDALVPGSDGERAGRLAQLVRVKQELLDDGAKARPA
jgi:chemotaxis protein methyltransferase CheR